MIGFIENLQYYGKFGMRKLKLALKGVKKLNFSQLMRATLILSGFIFLLSVFFFILERGSDTRRVLFYSDTFTYKLRGEERFVKKGADKSEDVRKLVDELLLGPVTHDLVRIFPQGTRLISMILNDDNLTLNLSKDILVNSVSSPIPLENSILACINSLRFNFPEIKKISFFIHGEELEIQIQQKNGEKIPLENVGFSSSMLQ